MGSLASWELRIKFNFARVLMRRNYNHSPQPKMSPMINGMLGCRDVINVPFLDPDGDRVRCRWAEFSLKECGGVCRSFPNATLDTDGCTLTYGDVTQSGTYAVALQIEDFYDWNDTIPLSSVPLQFLVSLLNGGNRSCSDRPAVSGERCVAIAAGSTYVDRIVATGVGPRYPIVDIVTQSPLGMTKSELEPGPDLGQWHVDVAWTPQIPDQVGMTLFCFLAMDNGSMQSDQHCMELVVLGVNVSTSWMTPPTVLPGSIRPTGNIPTNNTDWSVTFDQPISRPTRSAFIRIIDDSGNEVF